MRTRNPLDSRDQLLANPRNGKVGPAQGARSVARVNSLAILPTSRCNLACSYCYRRPGPPGCLSWDDVRPCLEWACSAPGEQLEVTFSGGEPLLEFELLKRAVRHLGQQSLGGRGVKIRVLTNGLLLNPRRLAFFAKHGVYLNLSCDGVPVAQDQRGRGTWEPLDRLLIEMGRRHPEWCASHLQVTMTLTPRNLHHFADSVAYLTARGAKSIGVSPVLTATPGWNHDLRPLLAKQLDLIFATVLQHFEMTGEVPFKAFRRHQEDNIPPGPAERSCAALADANPVLDTDGRLFGCMMFAPSGLGINDLRKLEIAEDLAWGRLDGPGFEERRETFSAKIRNRAIFASAPDLASRYGKCHHCPAAGVCKICPLTLLEFGAERAPLRVPALLCAWYMLSVEYNQRFPVQEDPHPPAVTPEIIRERRGYWKRRFRDRINPGGGTSRV